MKAINGEKLPKIDRHRLLLVRQDNINDPKIQAVLYQ